MKRFFLDWRRTPLVSVADYFIQHFSTNGTLDLRNVVITLPGKRASDRLEEILAEKAETLSNTAWYPPQFIPLENLPEWFYEEKKGFASPLKQIFTWLNAIDQIEEECPDSLNVLMPKRPNVNDIQARLALGNMLSRLHTELAAEILNFSHAAELCRHLNVRQEQERWETLHHLETKYLQILDSQQLWDKQEARIYAIDHPEEFETYHQKYRTEQTQFFLVGCTDLNKAQKMILNQFNDLVTAIIFAATDVFDKFDEFGCLKTADWQADKYHIALDDNQIIYANKPEDQAEAVITAAGNGLQHVSQIIISAPDDSGLPPLQEQFQRAGAKCRYIPGKPIQQTAIYRFLECWSAYIESPSYRTLAELIRHPAVESYLAAANVEVPNLLTQFDKYYNEHLPLTLENVDDTENIYAAVQELRTLLATDDVEKVLETLRLQSQDTYQKNVKTAIDDIRTITDANLLPLLLFQLENKRIAPHADHSAIEIIGWLDTALDDAEAVIVTGFNDGKIPQSVTSDIFLPNNVRQGLNIEDNLKRYARDAYNLSLILAQRKPENVRVITCKQNSTGDPLLPSRLLFAADDKTAVKRIQQFFAARNERRGAGSGQRETKDERKTTNKIEATDVPALSVSAFKSYIECPFRFYLKHVLHLQNLNDDAGEMTAADFGSLIHSVLDEFGKSRCKDSDDSDEIREFLLQKLDETAATKFGSDPRAAVAIQIERAAERLKAFATAQADWRSRGYQIAKTEFGINVALELSGGETMMLKGRIDRIDQHEETKEYVILDYKTGKKTPEEAHRKNKNDWIDLQLPLYHYIWHKTVRSANTQLGYFLLPAELEKTGITVADWNDTELTDAKQLAVQIAESIRAGRFEMAEKPPQYDDFEVICRLY